MKRSLALISTFLVTCSAIGQPAFVETGQDLAGPYVPEFFTSGASDVATADIDGDGDLDLVMSVRLASQESSLVFFNDGFGFFTPSTQRVGNAIADSLALGDLNGDGRPDLVLANGIGQANANEVFLNNGAGFFALSESLEAARSRAVVLADFSGDGVADLVFANARGTLGSAINQLYTNNGNGSFGSPVMLPGNAPSFSAAAGDLDGDGDMDLFVGNNGPNQVLLNTAGGLLESGAGYGDSDTVDVLLDDVDNDGDLDAITVNRGLAPGDPNRVWLNNGSGVFSDSGAALGQERSSGGALADVNGDGLQDLWFTQFDEPDDIWLNQGGTFINAGSNLGPTRSSSGVASGDFDRDGDADFAVTDFDRNRVWLNAGSNSTPGVSIAPVRAVIGAMDVPQLFGLEGFPLGLPLRVNNSQSGAVSVVFDLTGPGGTTSSELLVAQPGPAVSISPITPPTGALPFIAQLNLTDASDVPLTFPSSADYQILRRSDVLGEITTGQKGLELTLLRCFAAYLCRAFQGTSFPVCADSKGLSAGLVDLQQLRRLRDEVMNPTPAGRYYSGLFYGNSVELVEVVFSHPTLAYDVVEASRLWSPAIDSVLNGDGSYAITPEMGTIYREVTEQLKAGASPHLRQLIEQEDALIQPLSFVGQTAQDYWQAVTTARTEGLFRSGFEALPQ
ncbi:MAG: FG-GAP repeat domain-containing protein [Lysobacterales bacterium]